jgi:hypothetical protein
MTVRRWIAALLIALTAGVSAARAQQAPADARLLVTVMDPSGAVLPSATVSLTGLEDPTKKASVAPGKSNEKGLVIFEKLVPGRYRLLGEFQGFENGLMPDMRLRAGDNKHVLVLPLKRLEDSVTVSRDRQEAAADRAPLFGTALTREQIELLSDDPDEMRRQLQEMGGPDAVFKVDSFEGRDLPPKAQIKSVRISRDQFAAESHYAGGLFIEIVTQPGIGPLRAGTNFRFRDSAMDGKNPFTPTKPDSQNKNYGFNLGGTLVPEKVSFSLNLSGANSYVQPNIVAATPNGTVADVVRFRTPSDSAFASGYLDWAVTKDQTIRMSLGGNRSESRNLGVGQYDLPERAYATENSGYNFMLQEIGPLGRRFFINTRFYGSVSKSSSTSAFEAPTVRVNDAFTSGGAQRAGSRRTFSYTLQSDLDYVRGMHSWRGGISLEGYSYRSDETQNYLGTFTFSSLATYEASRPRSYTLRIGDPLIKYNNIQGSIYLQDDVRIRRNLTLTPGVRYELQTHLDDYNNIMPRIGLTWAPFKSGRTTLRVSYGIFHDWIAPQVYEQTLRIDGFRQQEINVLDPSFPLPGIVGTAPATNRYLYSDTVLMAKTKRLSAGFNQQITRTFSAGATYAEFRGSERARGHNLNQPVLGVRPDPRFSNVVEVMSDASMWGRSLNANLSWSLAAPSPQLQQARFNWRRVSVFGNFGVNRSQNNSEGPFAILPSNGVDGEWGPSGEDIRFRYNVSINSGMLKNLNAGINMSGYTAPPYTIYTGIDNNGDLVFNDRPVGVERNSARGSDSFNMNANFNYGFSFGKRRVALPPGISITSVGGVMSVAPGQPSQVGRYRIGFNASIFNITNRKNFVGYSGVMTSPFFGQPTNVSGVRRVDMGVNFSF